MKIKNLLASSFLVGTMLVGSGMIPAHAAIVQTQPAIIDPLNGEPLNYINPNQWVGEAWNGDYLTYSWSEVEIDTKSDKGTISFQYKWPQDELDYWKLHSKDDYMSFRLDGELTNGSWHTITGTSFIISSGQIVNGEYTSAVTTININNFYHGDGWVDDTDYTGKYKLEYTNDQFIDPNYQVRIDFTPAPTSTTTGSSTPVITAPVTTKPVTTAPVTIPPVTTTPVASKPVTTPVATQPSKPSQPTSSGSVAAPKPTPPINKGWKYQSGKWYFYSQSGVMQRGWLLEKGQKYYLDQNGKMVTGWEKLNSTWYYFKISGAMSTGWLLDKQKTYYLDQSGKMVAGWKKLNNRWYYFESNGAMSTGWKKVGAKWYYLYSDGHMAQNTKIGKYKIGKDGAWIQ